jgi:hypothetical protein
MKASKKKRSAGVAQQTTIAVAEQGQPLHPIFRAYTQGRLPFPDQIDFYAMRDADAWLYEREQELREELESNQMSLSEAIEELKLLRMPQDCHASEKAMALLLSIGKGRLVQDLYEGLQTCMFDMAQRMDAQGNDMATTKTTTAKKKAPAKKAQPEPTITRGYKGFDKQLRCRDMQFEVGKIYTEPEARLCHKGLHFVEFPLDALTYYSPVGGRFCEVSTPCVSPEKEGDSKRVTTEIHIGVEIGLPGLVKAAFDYVWKRALERHCASTGDDAHCASTGPRAHCASTGDDAHCASTGPRAHCASTGWGAHCASTGWGAHCASTGWGAHCASTGPRAHCASTGPRAHCASTGDDAHCASTGDDAHCATAGKNAIAAALGYRGTAKAGPEGWIVLAAYDDEGNLVCVKSAKVGGPEGIKPHQNYLLTVAGEFVETEDVKVVGA